MMTSELGSLQSATADLEDGEIDDLEIDDSSSNMAGSGASSNKKLRHSKRKGGGVKRKSNDSTLSSDGDKSKSKKPRKSKDKHSSSRRASTKHFDQQQYKSTEQADAYLEYDTEDEYREEDEHQRNTGVNYSDSIIKEFNSQKMSQKNVKARKPSRIWSYKPRSEKQPKIAVVVHEAPVCKFYLEGRCKKGDDCEFSHSTERPKKPLLCKFYAMDGCNKEDCLFMHSEFPCKYHHLESFCKFGHNCRFSHQPLSSEMRSALLEHVKASASSKQPDSSEEIRVELESTFKAENSSEAEPDRPKSLLGMPHQLPLHQAQSRNENDDEDSGRNSAAFNQRAPQSGTQLQHQPFKQMLFPPRPFPHPSDADSRSAHRLQSPPHQGHSQPLQPHRFQLPAQSVPKLGGALLARPAYSGPEPPARPFPSAAPLRAQQQQQQQQQQQYLPPPPPPLPPPPPPKPTPAAVAAASRALDAVASLLSEYCRDNLTFGEKDELAASPGSCGQQCETASPPEELREPKHESEPDSDEHSSISKPVLVFRPPPVCKRRIPYRVVPLDPIKRQPYSLMSFPRQVLAGSSAGSDPRLQQRQAAASASDPRLQSSREQQAEPEAATSGPSSARLQLNERSAALPSKPAAAAAAAAAAATADPANSGGQQRAVFDPRYRRQIKSHQQSY